VFPNFTGFTHDHPTKQTNKQTSSSIMAHHLNNTMGASQALRILFGDLGLHQQRATHAKFCRHHSVGF
jgi:hypothetical protein